MEMGTVSILQGEKPTDINNLCLILMLLFSFESSVPSIQTTEHQKSQSTAKKPVVHHLQSIVELLEVI